MAKALGIEATDITYKKYYAEYCAMHNLGTPRHTTEEIASNDTDQTKEHGEDQLKCIIPNNDAQKINNPPHNRNGRFCQFR